MLFSCKSSRFAKLVMTVCCASAGICGDAQPVPGRPADAYSSPQTSLIALGTGGGPIVRTRRSASGNLLLVRGRRYLIDAGSGTIARLKQSGSEPQNVDNLFLTHLHFDHTADVSSMLELNWLGGRGQHIMNVWGPPGTREMIDGALRYLAIGEKLYTAFLPPVPTIAQATRTSELRVSAAKTLVFKDDLVTVYAVENSHYSTATPQSRIGDGWKSYSYRFETPDKIIVFTGDTGPSDEVVELARGADILVSEVMNPDATLAYFRRINPSLAEAQLKPLIDHALKEHLTPEAVGMLAKKAAVKMVVLSHVAPGLDTNEDPDLYMAGVKRYYPGPVTLASDLDHFE